MTSRIALLTLVTVLWALPGQSATTTLVQQSGDPFEWYLCSTTTDTCATAAHPTYATALSCTVDRTARTTNKDFILIGHVAAYREATGNFYYVVPRQNGSDMVVHDALGETGSGTTEGSGMMKNWVEQVTVNAGTSTTFTWEIAWFGTTCSSTGGDRCCVDEAAFAILEKTADVQYASTGNLGCGFTGDTETALTLTFTPASTTTYYLVWAGAGQMFNWVANESSYGGPKFFNSTDAVTYQENNFGCPIPQDTANDSDRFMIGGVGVESVEASSHSFRVDYNCHNDASTNGCCFREHNMAAFPVSYFAENFDDAENPLGSTDTFNNTGGTHPDVTQAVSHTAGRDYVGVMAAELANEDPTERGHGSFTNGTNAFVLRNSIDRDGDTNSEYQTNFVLTFEKDAASGSRTWVPSFESSTTGGPKEAITRRVRMWIGGKDATN